ncbi:right-handed parallel beta-helix repeat-containing protein [Candidatus Poribacteria bacterium]|nr:right-handed parallel beta-helix repeat-containing protein [Candidatus Poribacteria bacterium]
MGNTTYYVNNQTGNDSHQGTSPSRPWKSVDRVNRATFRPGDRILFAGGQTFPGTIRLDKESSSTNAQKIVVGSYGTGRAVIDGENDSALVADGCEHLIIANLNCLGSGRKGGNTADGIKLLRTKDVTIDQVEVSGFRGSGVMTFGDSNIRITQVYAHENGFAGIAVNSAWEATTENLYIADCIAENNPGDPSVTDNHSGNGIVVSGVTGGVIEYCEAMNNGWDMPREGNGPVGIWGWNSDRLIIQYCISHDNKSPGLDGGGFDFDGGLTRLCSITSPTATLGRDSVCTSFLALTGGKTISFAIISAWRMGTRTPDVGFISGRGEKICPAPRFTTTSLSTATMPSGIFTMSPD